MFEKKKDRMHQRARRKLELVGDIADLADDLIGTEELEAEFLMSVRSQRRLDVGLKAEEDEVADREGTLGTAHVGMSLHMLLGTEQVLVYCHEHGLALDQHGGDIRHRETASSVKPK